MSTKPTTITTLSNPPLRPPRPSQPWHTDLTLDLLLSILHRSVFDPFICFLAPLCLRARARPYSSSAYFYTIVWACLVLLCRILGRVNRRVAYGKRRRVKWEKEVVVITGGGSGLGRLIAEVLGRRGVAVAVLDVREPEGGGVEEEEEGWRWYRCDVSRRGRVEGVRGVIERDLGKPTILINNAATAIGGLHLCTAEGAASLDEAAIDRTLSVNLAAHFNTLKAFLPGILENPSGGTVVTVSSILAHLAPAHLTDYAAAKAGVSALHTSLSNEIQQQGASDRVKTILVETGQIDTQLFSGVETPSNFFGPILDTRQVAKEIVRLIDAGESGLVRMPAYARFIDLYHILPAGLQRVVRWASGVDVAMSKGAWISVKSDG